MVYVMFYQEYLEATKILLAFFNHDLHDHWQQQPAQILKILNLENDLIWIFCYILINFLKKKKEEYKCGCLRFSRCDLILISGD